MAIDASLPADFSLLPLSFALEKTLELVYKLGNQ